MHVEYIPGKDNIVADALSRWAYPASKAFADVSIHGSERDDEDMKMLIEEERREERQCSVIQVGDLLSLRERLVAQGVITGSDDDDPPPLLPSGEGEGDEGQPSWEGESESSVEAPAFVQVTTRGGGPTPEPTPTSTSTPTRTPRMRCMS